MHYSSRLTVCGPARKAAIVTCAASELCESIFVSLLMFLFCSVCGEAQLSRSLMLFAPHGSCDSLNSAALLSMFDGVVGSCTIAREMACDPLLTPPDDGDISAHKEVASSSLAAGNSVCDQEGLRGTVPQKPSRSLVCASVRVTIPANSL